MTIALDRSRPYLLPSQLEELVWAVHKADVDDEDDAIEWKSSLNLEEPKAVTHHIARQIIGFANRMPEEAARKYGGYGYLVIGASPGEMKGVSAIDPAKLLQKVKPYVGGDIVWSPELLTLNNVRILIIIIEPPKYGDRIHSLQKRFESWNLGTPFVRRHGNVEVADPTDLNKLALRSHPTQSRTSVEIEALAPLDAWPEDELLTEWNNDLSRRYANGKVKSLGSPAIREWLEEMEEAFLHRSFWALHNMASTQLKLAIRNCLDRPAKDLKVRIRSSEASMVDGDLLDELEEYSPPGVPSPPTFGSVSLPPGLRNLAFPSAGEIRRGYEIVCANPLDVIFDVFDLHPSATVELPPLPLIAHNAVTGLNLQWESASMNLNGVSQGSLEVAVTEMENWPQKIHRELKPFSIR